MRYEELAIEEKARRYDIIEKSLADSANSIIEDFIYDNDPTEFDSKSCYRAAKEEEVEEKLKSYLDEVFNSEAFYLMDLMIEETTGIPTHSHNPLKK